MNDKIITLRNKAESARILYEADLFKQQGKYQQEYKKAVRKYSELRLGQEPALFINHAEAMFQGTIKSEAIILRFRPKEYTDNVTIGAFNLAGTCPHCGKSAWSKDLFDLTELGLELAKKVFEPEGMHIATHNRLSKSQLIRQHWGAIREIIKEKN